MNQNNIFSVIAAVLILQGLAFMFMGNQIMTSAFPAVDGAGHLALTQFMQVVAALSILVGLVTYAIRTAPNVVWAYTLGTLVLVSITFKHKFVDGINVPIPAMVIQVFILLACVYLWTQSKKVLSTQP